METYLDVLFVASAAIGLWICVRLPRLTPGTMHGALLCVLVSLAVPSLGGPLLLLLLERLPASVALLLSAFPAFVCAFTLMAFGLRYFAGRIGHAVR